MSTGKWVVKDLTATRPYDNLFLVDWHRVVLDEVQTIRNAHTVGSRAACALRRKFSHAMTGTAFNNSLKDIYLLFRWLKISPWTPNPISPRSVKQDINKLKSL